MPQPAVVIMARAPRTGTVRRALEPMLGPARCAALQAMLMQRAAAWASEVAPGAVHAAFEPADSGPELRALLGMEVFLFPQNGEGIAGRLADATTRVFGHSDGPMLIVWPELARWRAEHATSALDANLPVYLMPTVERQRDDSLSVDRLAATLATAFGVLATLLAAIGLYGVMAFLVARRTREIGLR